MSSNQSIQRAIWAILGTTTAIAGLAPKVMAADSATATTGLEEIVVTAQRRSENIQDVPITIQAISADQLTKLSVTTMDDVIKILPNVTFSNNGPGQGNIYMRGLSAGFAGNQSSASINPFPNVATYLDEQSLTFPARNLDVYMVDMERVEVLEGPQGTLFGGGAEAGVVRYITNKPKMNVTEGRAEGGYGVTAHGDPNSTLNAVLNLPLIEDKLAVRGVFYNDRRGGYIDNVPSTFTRSPTIDRGPSTYSSSYPANLAVYNNYNVAQPNQNPTTYQGMRLSALYDINADWNVLIQQSYQYMDAEGMPVQYPTGIDFQTLDHLQVTSFMPAWNRDKANSLAWTVNGKLGDLKAIYTGAYLSRHVDANMDYSNYARTGGGFYYSCTGGPTGASNFGAPGPSNCYSPIMGWHDVIENTHLSHEFRLSTPDEWRLRGLVGAYWEDFQIKDSMDFNQKTIPSCTPENLQIATGKDANGNDILDANGLAVGPGPVCLGNVTPVQAAINPATRGDNTNFGEDLQRGYKQTAFFTSWDYDLIPKVLTVTAGARYFRYVEQEVGSQYHSTSGCINIPNGDCIAQPINYDDHHATFTGTKAKANITWHITPDAMLYYTFSQGYRPGAFNRIQSAVTRIWVNAAGVPLANGVASNTAAGDFQARQFLKPLSYEPDSLTNNEIGFKSEFLEPPAADQRLLLPDGLERRADADLQPDGVRQHDLRHQRADLPGQGYRVADECEGQRRLHIDGLAVGQRRQADHFAVHPLGGRGAADADQPDSGRHLHHAGTRRPHQHRGGKPAGRPGLDARLLAKAPVLGARSLRLDHCRRLQVVLDGGPQPRGRHGQPALELRVGRRGRGSVHDLAALHAEGLQHLRRLAGICQGQLGCHVLRAEHRRQQRERVHDLGPGHQGGSAAASAGAGSEDRPQVLIRIIRQHHGRRAEMPAFLILGTQWLGSQ